MGRRQHLRITIAGLMAVVILAAFLFAALRTASALWAGIVYILVLGILCAGILKVAPPLRADRMMWLGFTVFGLAYFLVSVIAMPPFDRNGEFPTTLVISNVMDQLIPRYPAGEAILAGAAVTRWPDSGNERFYRLQIGQLILTLLFGLVGALEGWLLAAPSDCRREPAS